MKEIFFTSDTHFGHTNILKYCPQRGKKWMNKEEMDEGLRENWNKTIKPNDEVYHLGDLFFGYTTENILTYLKSLNGKINFIYGNHDIKVAQNEQEFLKIFASISHYEEIKINRTLICMFHFGQRVWNKSHRDSIHVFGHSHGTLPPYGKSVDVGIDSPWITGQIEHRPFHIDEILEWAKDKKNSDEIKEE